MGFAGLVATECKELQEDPYSYLSSSSTMSYVIFGRRVLNEHLAVGTLAVFGTGVALAMRGDSKADKSKIPAPAISSSSKDEEAFIREFVANMEREDAAAPASKKH
ncbi:hypothetical protein PCANC_18976 [Puccinia coronata f. sp. avenae]|uniref:Uncharacterized protein n=1 Tax=Puccinia coronata f. sp. avenae TaxID=200324 RepID=A0A2N5ST57_9BASI|nr:hypothetical protein PCANC_18976 [Puccinia coronata f. sp. avenae]